MKEENYLNIIKNLASIFSKIWLLIFMTSVLLLSKTYLGKNPGEILVNFIPSDIVLIGISISLLYIIPLILAFGLEHMKLEKDYGIKVIYDQIYPPLAKVLGYSTGISGIFFILIFLLVSSDPKEVLYISIYLSLLSYSILQSILILYSPHAFISTIILISSIIIPKYFYKTTLFTSTVEKILIDWLPIILLLILPLIQIKSFRKRV